MNVLLDIFSQDQLVYVLMLFFAIITNFLIPLYNCTLQNYLINYQWIKHVAGYVVLLILISIGLKTEYMHMRLWKCLLLYVMFIATMRAEFKYLMIILLLVFLSYIFYDYLKVYSTKVDQEQKNKYNQLYQYYRWTQLTLTLIIIALLIFGILVNLGKKSLEYGDDFNPLKFIMGGVSCERTKHLILGKRWNHFHFVFFGLRKILFMSNEKYREMAELEVVNVAHPKEDQILAL